MRILPKPGTQQKCWLVSSNDHSMIKARFSVISTFFSRARRDSIRCTLVECTCLHTTIYTLCIIIHRYSHHVQICNLRYAVRCGTLEFLTQHYARWWPCQVLDELDLPDNIFSKPHKPCQFPAICLGTKEFAWLDMSRVYSYEDGDKGSNSSNGMSASFKLG